MKSRPGLIVSSLVIANFLGQLMQTMLNTALPRMMEDLGMQENRAQWLITIYYLVAGISVPVAGFLVGRFTTRALLFTSVSAFAAGTLVSGLSVNFAFILTGRIIQAAGGDGVSTGTWPDTVGIRCTGAFFAPSLLWNISGHSC